MEGKEREREKKEREREEMREVVRNEARKKKSEHRH